MGVSIFTPFMPVASIFNVNPRGFPWCQRAKISWDLRFGLFNHV
jgi:hypothetical protein